MSDRSMVRDWLVFEARDAAIAAPFFDAPDDRPSRSEARNEDFEKKGRDADTPAPMTPSHALGGGQ
ncbi:MAG TPA: hypothetical protein VHV75_09915 [Solirubrobacteraceae bacterium]|jgi:hypothetical protein|nr:hypothetical protein [Solirubrobacteraceae bacterium]